MERKRWIAEKKMKMRKRKADEESDDEKEGIKINGKER